MADHRIITPQPGPQTQFLQADEHLVLYGGGGGGGRQLAA